MQVGMALSPNSLARRWRGWRALPTRTDRAGTRPASMRALLAYPSGEWSGRAGRCASRGGALRAAVRFARLIHRPVRDLGGPSVRAAFGGNLRPALLNTQGGEERCIRRGPHYEIACLSPPTLDHPGPPQGHAQTSRSLSCLRRRLTQGTRRWQERSSGARRAAAPGPIAIVPVPLGLGDAGWTRCGGAPRCAVASAGRRSALAGRERPASTSHLRADLLNFGNEFGQPLRTRGHNLVDAQVQAIPFALSTLRFDAGRFPPTPAACYWASWQLPRPDSHRLASTGLRVRHLPVHHLLPLPGAPTLLGTRSAC
jgi:hypothetical protein